MNYEFKKLTSHNLFTIMKVVKKCGLKNILQDIDMSNIGVFFENTDEKTNEDYEKAGTFVVEIVGAVVEHLSVAEKEIFTLLSEVSNLTYEQIENLSMDEFMKMLVDFVKKDEFKQAFKLVATSSK